MIIDTVHDVLVAARWLHFAAVFLLFGGAAFWFTVGWERSGSFPALPWSAAVTTRLLRCAAAVALLSGLAWLHATMATMAGSSADALDPTFAGLFFFDTPFGPVELARLVLLAALLAAAFLSGDARRRFALTAAVSAALLVSQAWLGHAAEGGDTPAGWAMVASYAAHVLAGAAWLGGLPILLIALAEVGRAPDRADRHAFALALLLRFSTMATVAVGAILLSGAVNTVFRVGADPAISGETAYGRVLMAKLLLVAVVLALAAVTRFIVAPRLGRATAPDATVELRPRPLIRLELGFGLLVLLAAAVLGITPPPL